MRSKRNKRAQRGSGHPGEPPNPCASPLPALLPKSLSGSPGLERSQVLSSTCQPMALSALGPSSQVWGPQDHHAGERCPRGLRERCWPRLARTRHHTAGQGAARLTNYHVPPGWW